MAATCFQLKSPRFTIFRGEILKMWMFNVNPGLITPNGCLIGRVPFKYQMMTIGGAAPWFINPGLTLSKKIWCSFGRIFNAS
jgi:hypothetical protein